LQITENSLGAEHPSVATTLGSLAALYQRQKKLDDAELLFKRCLIIREATLGTDHPDIATALNNLACVYDDQGKLDAAEPLYKRNLQIREKTLEADHPRVLFSLSELARLQFEREAFAEAAAMMKRLVDIQQKKIQQKKLSAKNVELAKSKRELARILACQDKVSEAEPLINAALKVLRKQPRVGENKQATASVARAIELDDGKRFFEASRWYRIAAEDCEQAFGPDDIRVAECQELCAKALRKLGREKEATVRDAEAAAIRKRAEK
jgi:tetratricopeptide (TPR) repeat protein